MLILFFFAGSPLSKAGDFSVFSSETEKTQQPWTYMDFSSNRPPRFSFSYFSNSIIKGEREISSKNSESFLKKFFGKCHANNIFDNLEIGATVGTTGLGLELATPVTRWVRLRAGVDWMPRIKVPLDFGINTFSDGIPNNNFSKVQQMVYDLTGIEIDDKVQMIGKPDMLNFKLLVDVYPFRNNRHWHFTTGFFLGSDRIATATNDLSEKPTLVGLNIYNRAYQYFTTLESIFDVPLGGGAYMDPELVEDLQEKFLRYGRMGIHIGDFKNGTPYIMEPAPDGTVSAKALVNSFKPYVGFGYSSTVDPNKRLELGVEAGAWFWGGAANVINHDYATGRDINMTKDLVNVKGEVGSYLRLIKALPVYPAINFRISYTIF